MVCVWVCYCTCSGHSVKNHVLAQLPISQSLVFSGLLAGHAFWAVDLPSPSTHTTSRLCWPRPQFTEHCKKQGNEKKHYTTTRERWSVYNSGKWRGPGRHEMNKWWFNVGPASAGPTLNQHSVNVSCLPGHLCPQIFVVFLTWMPDLYQAITYFSHFYVFNVM